MLCFICPLCREPLIENSHGVACSRRHQFDRAREGYFHLLPVHHKNSRQPGDAKLQLQARRQFLNADFFSPLVGALKHHLPASTQHLLDIGCGEGYFTRHLASALDTSAQVYGIDIAKDGVRLAAKGRREFYAVASSYALPIADHSMDVITRIYAPSKDSELARVLKKDGRLIIVTPGANHLLRLRQQLYQDIRPHPEPQAPEGFILQETQQLRFELITPAGSLTEALLQMTPFAWRLTEESLAQMAATGWQDQAEFRISLYRRV
ncbi:MAG TPA: methyltransferase domain-containing protein [Cellvibrio sp.]|jgi:23S rRNA (guanine745-N1)-methyltransferase|nr:methyltransferase domain-containing protein [Cellvibrio sp.]